MHRAALAAGIAARAPGQLGHHPLGIHAAGQHVAVVAVGGDPLVAVLGRGLQPDHHRLLADVEMAEAADQPHAVELARLLLETADQQHLAVELQQFVLGRVRLRGARALSPSTDSPRIGFGLALNYFNYTREFPCGKALNRRAGQRRRRVSADDDLVRPAEAENLARLLVEQVEVEMLGSKAAGSCWRSSRARPGARPSSLAQAASCASTWNRLNSPCSPCSAAKVR